MLPDRVLRSGVDLLSRRPRQRRPPERRRPVRRPDRPRPLGHLLRSTIRAASRSARAPSPTTGRPAAASRCPASAASSAATAPTRARPARPTTTSSPAARPARGLPVVDGDRPAGAARRRHLRRHLTCAAPGSCLAIAALAPAAALAQSAGEVERCFQNPGSLRPGRRRWRRRRARRPRRRRRRSPRRRGRPRRRRTTRPCCRAPIPIAGKIQESLRTLDKYNGPIDGNLQSEATIKAISDWQKGHGTNPVGKLTPQEAQQLNAEAAQGADPAHRSVDADGDGRDADAVAAAVEIQRRCAEGRCRRGSPNAARRPSPRPRRRRSR